MLARGAAAAGVVISLALEMVRDAAAANYTTSTDRHSE